MVSGQRCDLTIRIVVANRLLYWNQKYMNNLDTL